MFGVIGEDGLVPRARSWLPVACEAVLGLLTLVFVWLLDADRFMERAEMIAFSLTVAAFIHSMCLFAEEWFFHARQRYHGRINEILQACFKGDVILGMCAIVLMLMFGGVSFSREHWSTMAIMCAVYLLLNSLGVQGPTPVEISEICEVKKMNVAHGLAWSFYIGYLKLILPVLQNKINQYSSTGARLSSPRLHILLPLNAVVPSKPEEEDTNVVFHENLPELELDIAGVRNRSYKNSVYKITQNNKTFSCVLEYATPLRTLYQMSQESSACFGERERKQQVLLFYRTLSQILDNSLECRNRYRLLLLNDEHTGDPHQLSREIIQHLKQQDGEIHMDPIREPPNEAYPVPEEGQIGDFNGALFAAFPEGQMSSAPSLMFSLPQSLRSEPVETTDY
ncbi:stimulator of interferon genes protein [Rhinichthys klamathensis goyatoka]|uniref:stimulator of interferon genes protein n=1 Tax=Rhinichthys klamathensis goyatoka TaxID=3034132 RepID=UPI0024B56761|nr:stimulator of interferon genes protein [Rhinichthys klamathensis goyatoka]